jgi:aryl-alcohol dehydrogenase-like predicted oxidoreductase
MKYRKLGNTGLIVSELALGSMQFGGKMHMGNLGQEDTTKMVKSALDRGINLIDTADVYSLGESETLLGNALKACGRKWCWPAKSAFRWTPTSTTAGPAG